MTIEDDRAARRLAWDACYNAREVGDYPAAGGRCIRRGVLVRADNLHRLTPAGQAALRAYGIRTIVDLRLAGELAQHPNPFATAQDGDAHAPRYWNRPLHDEASNPAIAEAEKVGTEYLVIVEQNKLLVGAAVRAVAAGLTEGGVVVHCHGGKDRTGILVALLLELAGVPRDTIIADYTLSEACLEPAHAAWMAAQANPPAERPYWMFTPARKMVDLLAHLDAHYGGVPGYLAACGVTAEEIDEVRARLVAPTEKPS
ncbi:MAG TPA: tyrosine-protein phosphatase [Chloroflexia bacterium]|nr:tyrosine-protein phosphatase [Chloroflexia bacterium]